MDDNVDAAAMLAMLLEAAGDDVAVEHNSMAKPVDSGGLLTLVASLNGRA